MKPTIYLTNWSSARTPGCFGPGAKYNAMAAPRHWEIGQGKVRSLAPALDDLRAVKAGKITERDYFDRYIQKMERSPHLAPSLLAAFEHEDGVERVIAVADGDTIYCSCGRAVRAQGRCHLWYAAAFLQRAGWRVVLDGTPVPL